MDTGHLHDSSTPHDSAGPFVTSMVLYICSWLFMYLESLSVEDIWKWFFRILSAISLLLIIYINWSKAKEIFKKKDTFKGQDSGMKDNTKNHV